MKIGLTMFLLLSLSTLAMADVVVHFDELSDYSNSGATGSYYDGYGAGAPEGAWVSQGVSFNTSEFGPGWSYSNVNDTQTTGFDNQWASITGSDVEGGGNYAIGSSYGANGAYINLPEMHRVNSIQVSNATYPALSMRDGDAYAKKFGGDSGSDQDFFKVTFTGFAGLNASGLELGSEEFFLADYRFTDHSLDYIVDDWNLVDLTGLGDARSIGIELNSSDVGSFGMNTPAYVAIDNFSIRAVPEPLSLPLLVCGCGILGFRRKRTVRRMSKQ